MARLGHHPGIPGSVALGSDLFIKHSLTGDAAMRKAGQKTAIGCPLLSSGVESVPAAIEIVFHSGVASCLISAIRYYASPRRLSGSSFLEFTALQLWQVRLLMYSPFA